MGFPEADPPLITCFSASSAALSIQCSSPLKVDPSLPSSPPLFDLGFGVASMGFPEADPPLFLLFSVSLDWSWTADLPFDRSCYKQLF